MHRDSNRNSVTKFDEKLELLDGKGDGWFADEARAMAEGWTPPRRVQMSYLDL